jgi:Metallo-peptidase family M12B Reprolysin-like
MAASIRALASCVGISGPFSILGDFFGFSRRRLPPDPTGARVEVSLKEQITRLRGPHSNLNVIAVGSDQFTDNDDIQIDYSIFRLRNIYRPVGVGIGRVQHWGVPTADANGLDTPTTTGDLEDLTQDWTIPNDGIDMFVPHNMSVPAPGGGVLFGRSAPPPGPCDKNAEGMNGTTCGLWGSEQTARTFAHELGHYLGLSHNHGANTCPTTTTEQNNLMAQSGCVTSTGNLIRTAVLLKSSQGDDMDDHCSINAGC